jgi:hypothetical protein
MYMYIYIYIYFEFLIMVHVVAVVIGTSAVGLSSCLREDSIGRKDSQLLKRAVP